MDSTTIKTNSICPICNSTNFTPIYKNTLLKCKNCSFITANMTINQNLLKNIYTENYFMGEEYTNYIEEKPALQKNFEKNIKKLTKKKLISSPQQTLEIGCSYGFFGEVATTQFPKINYTGIDIVKEACEYATKLLPKSKIFCSNYLTQEFNQQFDHVFMWDVIEHLQHPEKFIQKIQKELTTKGKLFISTGDINAFLPKIQKEKWRLIHPPSHLHYFSKKTLSKLLEKNGFKILNISYPYIYRSLRQIYYSTLILNKKPNSLTKKIYNIIPKNLSMPINTFDIFLITAQKI